MAAAAWGVVIWGTELLPTGKLGELILLAVTGLAGMVIYFTAAVLLRIPEARMVADIAKRILKRGG